MKKSYRFKAKYTAEVELQIELDETQQKDLETADLTLIRAYLKEEGFASFISHPGLYTDYEVLNYEEIDPPSKVYNNISLTNLDICFFNYHLKGRDKDIIRSDYVYGNLSDEDTIKAFIINSPKNKSLHNLMIEDIFDLTINR